MAKTNPRKANGSRRRRIRARWNSASTYYTIRDKVIPGNTINPAKIEVNMGVWMK